MIELEQDLPCFSILAFLSCELRFDTLGCISLNKTEKVLIIRLICIKSLKFIGEGRGATCPVRKSIVFDSFDCLDRNNVLILIQTSITKI